MTDYIAVFTSECVPVSVYVCPFVSECVITWGKFPGRRARNIIIDFAWHNNSYIIIIYRIASNYGQSRINAWSHLVARGNSIITKINTRSRINAGSFVVPQ